MPLVNSVSYGWQGDLAELGCKPADVAAIDVNFAKLAAKGISMLIASGDTGAAFTPSPDSCGHEQMKNVTDGDVLSTTKEKSKEACCDLAFQKKAFALHYQKGIFGAGTCVLYSAVRSTAFHLFSTYSEIPAKRPPVGKFYPSWPASSPWVTAVGATRFVGNVVGGEEMASDQFGSGGGFSMDFNNSEATWQQTYVAKYLAQNSTLPKFPGTGSFPTNGRATPDVSALGEGYEVYVQGRASPVGGTSASTPAFAGLVSLLNEARLKAGKKPMGFLNPFLYANPAAFFDVVKGTNAIGRCNCPFPYGFAAAPGWDPATGLGTPHYDKLLAASMKAAGINLVEA